MNVVLRSSFGFSVFDFFDEDLEGFSVLLRDSEIADLIADFDQDSISFFSDFVRNLIWQE